MPLEAFWLNNPQEYYLYTDDYIERAERHVEDMDFLAWRSNEYAVTAIKQALSTKQTLFYPREPLGIKKELSPKEMQDKILADAAKHNPKLIEKIKIIQGR